jgi:hypothetical protein
MSRLPKRDWIKYDSEQLTAEPQRPTLEDVRAQLRDFNRIELIADQLRLIFARDFPTRDDYFKLSLHGIEGYMVRAVEEATERAWCKKCDRRRTTLLLCPGCGERYDLDAGNEIVSQSGMHGADYDDPINEIMSCCGRHVSECDCPDLL